MDEQRFDAYINLIVALLNCPEGQENEILQARLGRSGVGAGDGAGAAHL